MAKYLPILTELKTQRKLRSICDQAVDDEQRRVAIIVGSADFDDPHIVGLFCASGCRIFASLDKRADLFVKDRRLYPKGQKPPSIYRTARHACLLRDSNIVQLRNAEPDNH